MSESERREVSASAVLVAHRPEEDAAFEELREAIDRYVSHGIDPGGFLSAVIQNDLALSISYASPMSLRVMPRLVLYLHSKCPGSCHGSHAAFNQWRLKKAQKPQHEAEG